MEDALIAAASRELHTATLEATALRAAIVNLERSQGSSDAICSGVKQIVPADFRETLNKELNAYKKAKAERVAVETLKKKANEVLQTAMLNAKAASDETSSVLEVVVDDKYKSPAEIASVIDRKQRELESLVKEHQLLHQTTSRNLAHIKQLSQGIDELSDMDWELYRIKAEVGIKETQLQSVIEETNSIQRIFARKTALLQRLQSNDISSDVSLLAHHKVSEQKKLLMHKDLSVKGVSATRHGAITVKLHEDKLHLIGSAAYEVLHAMGQIDEDADGECDAVDVDEVRESIQTAQHEEQRVQLAMDYYDNQIRNLEARVEILQHAIDVRHRDIDKDEKALAKRCVILEADVAKQKAAAQGLLEHRKKSVSQLHSTLKR